MSSTSVKKTRKRKITTARQSLMEFVSRLVNPKDPKMGLVQKMLDYIEQMDKPKDKFYASLELIKFIAPQMKAVEYDAANAGDIGNSDNEATLIILESISGGKKT